MNPKLSRSAMRPWLSPTRAFTVPFTLIFIMLLTLPLHSSAAYRCLEQGKLVYQNTPCPNGIAVAAPSPVKPEDQAAALKQNAKEKAELAKLLAARSKEEAQAAKLARQTSRETRRQATTCQRLAMQQKWAEQDAADAKTADKAEKAKKKARRIAEKMQASCAAR